MKISAFILALISLVATIALGVALHNLSGDVERLVHVQEKGAVAADKINGTAQNLQQNLAEIRQNLAQASADSKNNAAAIKNNADAAKNNAAAIEDMKKRINRIIDLMK